MLNSGYPHYPGEISRRSANGVCSGGKMRKGPPFFVDSTLHHLVFRSREKFLSQTKMAFILDLQLDKRKESQQAGPHRMVVVGYWRSTKFKQGDHWVLGFGSGHTVDWLSQASSKVEAAGWDAVILLISFHFLLSRRSTRRSRPLTRAEGEKINHQFINNIILSERMKVVSVMQQFIKSTLEEDVSEAEGR